jgi:hypothetical protein
VTLIPDTDMKIIFDDEFQVKIKYTPVKETKADKYRTKQLKEILEDEELDRELNELKIKLAKLEEK